MNRRAKSEDPTELLAPGMVLLHKNGFKWVAGSHGARDEKVGNSKFLIAIPGPVKAESISAEACPRFAVLDGSEKSFLEFAATHGTLGCARVHGHLADGSPRIVQGELLHEWRSQLSEFQRWFEVYFLIKDRDLVGLKRFILAEEASGADPIGTPFSEIVSGMRAHGDLRQWMSSALASTITQAMEPVNYEWPQGCFLADCSRNRAGPPNHRVTSKLGGVSYRVEYAHRNSPTEFQSKVQARGLLWAIWLQFSQLVSGDRTYRRCEAPDCQEWMDITETARKGSKRIHNSCSRRLRMQRYRQNVKELKNG